MWPDSELNVVSNTGIEMQSASGSSSAHHLLSTTNERTSLSLVGTCLQSRVGLLALLPVAGLKTGH